jgi:hypothetical protein
MTKKKYKIGTCFGCQKCLYCGIDLIKEICNCKKTTKPTKTNRTDLVKNAFPRVFKPNSSFDSKQLDFIKNKNECFQYGYDLTKNIQLSFCSACNSSYQRLATKNTQKTQQLTEDKDSIKTTEVITILDPASNTTSKHNSLVSGLSGSESEDDIELEINYKLIIKKADGTLLPAKNQSVTISELDEFLLAIQNNVTALLEDEKIYANDYSVSFKSEKGQGAGTLLIDSRDFKDFHSEYTKLVATKRTMAIFVIMKKRENEKLVKRKKKVAK